MVTLEDLLTVRKILEAQKVPKREIQKALQFSMEKKIPFYQVFCQKFSPKIWEEGRQLAMKEDHWPEKTEQILLDNQIVYAKLLKSPQVNLGKFNEAYRFWQNSSPKLLRLHEVLVSSGMLDAKRVPSLLDIHPKQLLLCPQCKTHFEVHHYCGWKPYPCMFCSSYLIPLSKGDEEDHSSFLF